MVRDRRRRMARLLPLILAGALVGAGEAEAPATPPAPYRDLSRATPGFHGPGRELPAPEGLASVKLGLLGPARRPDGDRLREGAELAIAEANAQGGFDGLPYEVVFRADDGPWGVGAQQVTALAYDDGTWAIVGGLEGGDAHLAELVAAKLWIPVVTPTASDLSIDYANVPWVFRCSPSDDRQARALLRWAREEGCRRVLVFTEDDREGRTGARRLERAARAEAVSLLGPREFRPHLAADVVEPGDLGEADAVVIWARPRAGARVLEAIRRAGFPGPVLAPACFLSPELPVRSVSPGELVVAAPCDLSRRDDRWEEFRERYRDAHGRDPDAIALFAYDATSLVIAAIERAGLNRARIRDALAESTFDGIAGTIRFDGLGGSALEPVLMQWRDDGWVRVVPSAPRTHVAPGADARGGRGS